MCTVGSGFRKYVPKIKDISKDKEYNEMKVDKGKTERDTGGYEQEISAYNFISLWANTMHKAKSFVLLTCHLSFGEEEGLWRRTSQVWDNDFQNRHLSLLLFRQGPDMQAAKDRKRYI